MQKEHIIICRVINSHMGSMYFETAYCDAKNLLLYQNGVLFLHVWRRGRLALDPS